MAVIDGIDEWDTAADGIIRELEPWDQQRIRAISGSNEFSQKIHSWQDLAEVKIRPALHQVGTKAISVLDHFQQHIHDISETKANIFQLLGCFFVALDVINEHYSFGQKRPRSKDSPSLVGNLLVRLLDKIKVFCSLIESKSFPGAQHPLPTSIYRCSIDSLVTLIQYFRKGSVQNQEWQAIEKQFELASKAVDDECADFKVLNSGKSGNSLPLQSLSRFSTFASATTAVSALDNSGLDSGPPSWTKVVMLPQKNLNFFGRELILSEMERKLHDQGGRQGEHPIVITLSGMAGVGKSQVALEYAHRKAHLYSIILWLSAETTLALDQDFRHAATKLKLDDIGVQYNLKNRVEVLNKLENTDSPWLVIFDNVEDCSVVTSAWPRGKNGSILLTCIDSERMRDGSQHRINIPVFNSEEGTAYLLRELDKQSPDSETQQAAKKLSQEIGGHPFGIRTMAAYIRSCQIAVKDCAEAYGSAMDEARHQRDPNRPGGYKKDVSTVFEMSFKNLADKPNAATLLGILSLLGADSVPCSFFSKFEASSNNEIPKDLHFCCLKFKLHSAEGDLLSSSLIEKTDQKLSMHRLAQNEVQYFSGDVKRQQSFENASFLLWHAFPQQEKGRYMHDGWTQGNLYANHVLFLTSNYTNTGVFPQLEPSIHFVRLVSNCAWFLFEKGKDMEAREILRGGRHACKRLQETAVAKGQTDEEVDLILAHMLNTKATLDLNAGHFDKAIDRYERSLQIRSAHLPEDDEDISGVINNLSLAYESARLYDKSFEFRERSLAICQKHTPSAAKDTKIKKRDLQYTRLLVATGRIKEAEELFPDLLAFFQNIKSWLFLGQLHISWGRYFFVLGQYEKSNEMFVEASRQYDKVGGVKYHPEAIASVYKIGRVALAQDNIDRAVTYLQKAKRRVSESKEPGPQMARISFMLAQALKQKDPAGNAAEIKRLESDARSILVELRPDLYASADFTEEDLDSIVRCILR